MACSLIPKDFQQGKLAPRGTMLVHLGVDEEVKAWRALVPNTQEVVIVRNLHFTEGEMWKGWRPSHPTAGLEVGELEEVLLN
jgi:hypothetical protein